MGEYYQSHVHMRTLKLREIKALVQGHALSESTAGIGTYVPPTLNSMVNGLLTSIYSGAGKLRHSNMKK